MAASAHRPGSQPGVCSRAVAARSARLSSEAPHQSFCVLGRRHHDILCQHVLCFWCGRTRPVVLSRFCVVVGLCSAAAAAIARNGREASQSNCDGCVERVGDDWKCSLFLMRRQLRTPRPLSSRPSPRHLNAEVLAAQRICTVTLGQSEQSCPQCLLSQATHCVIRPQRVTRE
jgi:hypothetical protein